MHVTVTYECTLELYYPFDMWSNVTDLIPL